jgi:DNA-binding transcriptional regulator GbsR (MarR family)
VSQPRKAIVLKKLNDSNLNREVCNSRRRHYYSDDDDDDALYSSNDLFE